MLFLLQKWERLLTTMTMTTMNHLTSPHRFAVPPTNGHEREVIITFSAKWKKSTRSVPRSVLGWIIVRTRWHGMAWHALEGTCMVVGRINPFGIRRQHLVLSLTRDRSIGGVRYVAIRAPHDDSCHRIDHSELCHPIWPINTFGN